MSDEGVVDLSDAPRHTGFGEDNPANKDSGSVLESALTAASQLPVVSLGYNVHKAIEGSEPVVDKLFEGEATIDELLAVAESVVGVMGSMAEFADLLVSNTGEPDPAYWFNMIVKAGLDFLLAYFQPLEDLLGCFTGNPERINVSAMMWGRAGTALVDLAEYVGKTTIEGVLPAWSGGTAASAGLRLSEFQAAIQSCALVCELIEALMERTAGFADLLFNRAKQGLADLISWPIEMLAMFLSPPTVAEAVATLAVMIAKEVAFMSDVAIRALRVYAAAAQTAAALMTTTLSAMPLLTRMAEAPR